MLVIHAYVGSDALGTDDSRLRFMEMLSSESVTFLNNVRGPNRRQVTNDQVRIFLHPIYSACSTQVAPFYLELMGPIRNDDKCELLTKFLTAVENKIQDSFTAGLDLKIGNEQRLVEVVYMGMSEMSHVGASLANAA